MQQRYRMRKNGHFRYVYRKGKRAAGSLMRLHYVKAWRLQVGFSVSRQVGKAVTRNLVKRRLREAFRAQIPGLLPGGYVITANPEAASASYQQLESQLLQQLQRVQAFAHKP